MRKIWLALLASLTFACLLMASSCAIFGGKQESKLAFNEMCLTEVILGDPIMLDEYIDPMLTDDYTAILTCDETGEERDLKVMGQWTTDRPGTYTFTYTVNSGEYAGTISTKIQVLVQKATWQYSNPTLVYRAGDTMYFAALKRNLNLLVKSYYDYEFFIKSVSYQEQKELLTGMNSYTFPEEGTYTFTFGIRTEDGQELTADQKISVRAQQVLASGAEEWMAENNITVHDYTYVSPNGQVSLDGGYFNNSILDDNVPYIAFNGEEGVGYGPGTYVMTEFTGKNLPQVAFFCDEVTSSYTDGKSGILITNGITGNDGTDFYGTKLNMSRLTIFGPYKASFPEFDNRGRMLATGSIEDPFPISYHALSENDQYKYIVGVQDASATHVTIRMLLINMTTLERVCDYTTKLTNSSGAGTLNLPEDYFKGSIVLYGRYGQKMKMDKVYMPIVGVGDIYDLDQAASFKSAGSYKTEYDLRTTVNVADYIEIPDGDYEFKVFAPNGEEVEIDADGNFTYNMSGKYRLYFDPKQGDLRPAAISVRVLYDLESDLPADYLELEGAIIGFDDWNFITNKKADFINEGAQSIEYYTINSKNGSITIHVSKSFMDFIFLSRLADGISFDVYSAKALTYKLADQGKADKLAVDYTGEIPAETWTTLTITREMVRKNIGVYDGKSYAIAIELRAEDKFIPREVIYVDNIKLKIVENKPTIAAGAQTFLEENNMTAYGYELINDDLKASLYEGIYAGEWNKIKNDDIPYIAYNGNYGAGSYIVADFTGKSVPQLCFFVKDITPSLTDGRAGFYVHTGMLKQNGEVVSPHDGGRVTYFGPNKMEACTPDNAGRVGTQHGYKTSGKGDDMVVTEQTSPLSINGLVDGVHYRYVIGIKSARAGHFVVEQLLINLDTNEEVVRYVTDIKGDWITEDYISGNIVMYGRYNYAITLDKIYAAYTNVSDINSIDKVSEILG